MCDPGSLVNLVSIFQVPPDPPEYDVPPDPPGHDVPPDPPEHNIQPDSPEHYILPDPPEHDIPGATATARRLELERAATPHRSTTRTSALGRQAKLGETIFLLQNCNAKNWIF